MSAAWIAPVVLAVSLLAGLASSCVFRLVDVEARRRYLEVGTAIFLQSGVIYAVFLAFIFGQALTGYVEADNAIHTECAALHGASMLSHALPEAPRAEMTRALDTYLTAVIDKEWPMMRTRRSESPEAEQAQITMIDRANSLPLSDAQDVANRTRIVDLLLEAHRNREYRVFQAGQGIPSGLWAMVIAYCGVLVTLVFFSSVESAWPQATLSGIFGGLNAITLLACFFLQYPFEGPFQLSPAGFLETKARVVSTLPP